jgi:hypothetical protein
MKAIKTLFIAGSLAALLAATGCGGEPESGNGGSIDSQITDTRVSEDGGHLPDVYDGGTLPDATGGDDYLPDASKTDGGDTTFPDAGVKDSCDEYLGTTIPAWATVKVPWDMFVKYFSNVPNFNEKVDALKDKVTDINGEKSVILSGVYDPKLPSAVRITSSEVLFGVAGIAKADGSTYDGLCGQNLGDGLELNAAYQDMMSGTGK